jgi:hypothetical protein
MELLDRKDRNAGHQIVAMHDHLEDSSLQIVPNRHRTAGNSHHIDGSVGRRLGQHKGQFRPHSLGLLKRVHGPGPDHDAAIASRPRMPINQ